MLWLEEYLQRWKKTLIVVSHDRDLLNTVTTDIIHLHDLKLHAYKGNFAQFEEMYDQRRREVNKAYEKYEKQLRAAKTSGKNAKQNQEKVRLPLNHPFYDGWSTQYSDLMRRSFIIGQGPSSQDPSQAQQGQGR